MNPHVGLYFPYFHFPNDEWLKLAALYWDKLYRIVPYGYLTQRDSALVTSLAQERQMIASLHPEDFYEDLEAIKNEFVKLIESHSEELVKYYGIEQRYDWADDEYTAKYAPDANPKLAYIYNDKIEGELKQVLFDHGLGTTRSDKGDEYQWIGMHPKLANVYMAALAEKLAHRAQLHPLAYDTENYFAVSGFTFERLAQVLLVHAQVAPSEVTPEEMEASLAFIALRAVMPKDIRDIPIDRILALREKHPSEFGRFQEFVQGIVAELPNLEQGDGQAFVNDYLDSAFEEKIQPRISALEDSARSMRIETAPTVLNLGFRIPAAAGLVTREIGGSPLLGATGGVAFGFLKTLGDRRKAAKSEIRESDVAYLLHVRQDLTPESSLGWLAARPH